MAKNKKLKGEITQKEGVRIVIVSLLFGLMECIIIYLCLKFAVNNVEKINNEFISDVLLYSGCLFALLAIIYNTGSLIFKKLRQYEEKK